MIAIQHTRMRLCLSFETGTCMVVIGKRTSHTSDGRKITVSIEVERETMTAFISLTYPYHEITTKATVVRYYMDPFNPEVARRSALKKLLNGGNSFYEENEPLRKAIWDAYFSSTECRKRDKPRAYLDSGQTIPTTNAITMGKV